MVLTAAVAEEATKMEELARNNGAREVRVAKDDAEGAKLATARRNATIDWTVRESARAKLRAMVRRILRKYGYPPDKQEKATQTVLAQAELLCADWT